MDNATVSELERSISKEIELFFPGTKVRILFPCAPPGYLIVRFRINLITGDILPNTTKMMYYTSLEDKEGSEKTRNSVAEVPGGPVPPCVPKVSFDKFIFIDENCGEEIRKMFDISSGEGFL